MFPDPSSSEQLCQRLFYFFQVLCGLHLMRLERASTMQVRLMLILTAEHTATLCGSQLGTCSSDLCTANIFDNYDLSQERRVHRILLRQQCAATFSVVGRTLKEVES